MKPEETLKQLFIRLGTSVEGLSSTEAQDRLRTHGPNEFVTVPLRRRLLEILRTAANPVILILLLAGFASAFLGQTFDAVLIALMVLLSTSLNYWQTYRSAKAVRELQKGIAPTATVRRDGRWKEVPRREIVVGDVIHLSSGDLVPADARLIEASDLHVQQAALTGESLPTEKFVSQEQTSQKGAESPDLVFLGTSIVSGTATAVIFAAGPDTAFGDIVERLSEQPEETEFERGTHQFGVLILQTVFFLVFFILVVNLSLGRDAFQSLLFSVALAVGLTPEFLPMITTVTLGQGAVQMAKEKVIVKHLSSIQNLGSIDVLCSDKTGTLTSGEMSFDSSLDPLGTPSSDSLFWASLNSKFETGIRSPIDQAILKENVAGTEAYQKTDEIPFDFDRRRLSVVVRKENQIYLVTKGAPESLLEICSHYEQQGQRWPLESEKKNQFQETFQNLSRQGFRVVAVAIRQVPAPSGYKVIDEKEMTFKGFVTFADHLLEGVSETLHALRHDGIQVKILTGDNELVTKSICEQVGIETEKIVLGRDLELADEAALAQIASSASVFARVSPAQKHQIIRALKSRGHVVGFLGDGINDAPSLHSADVGISVAGAADVARDASDIILLERNLKVLHAGILAGRKSFGNVFKYLLMGTSSNFGNMFSMAGAALFLPFLPMLPTQILLNNFMYDLAQVTIPTDKVDPAFVRKPQRWNINLIRNFMVTIGPISSLYDFLTFYILIHFFHFDEILFHTGWFLESLATQTLVLFVIRTVGRPWNNRPSLALSTTVIAVVLIGAFLPYSSLAETLGFQALPSSYFFFLSVVVLTYLFCVEVVKRKIMFRLVGPMHSKIE